MIRSPEHEVERIADELSRGYDEDPWHGGSLLTVLHGVDAEGAAARPIPGAHSIWELVLHLTTWMNAGAGRVRLRRLVEVSAEDDWPHVPEHATEREWARALRALDDAHLALLDTLAGLRDEELDDVLGRSRDRPQGAGVSYYVLLHGLSQHMAYHAGQIALLRKALGRLR